MTGELIPVDDEELLYRRVSVRSKWWDNGALSAEAFSPNKRDTTGISVFRARFRSIEDAANGPSPDGYYVVVLHTGELRARGIQVSPQPDIDDVWDDSHAELPQIRIETKRTSDVEQLKQTLVEFARHRPVQGPFRSTQEAAE